MTNPPRPTIAWSFSALNTFENCPRKFWATKIKKLVSDYNAANIKGDAEHKAFDAHLSKNTPLPAHIAQFQPVLDMVKALPGQMYSEYSMALDANYVPCKGTDWNRVWMRSIADVITVNGFRAHVVDWKFGKAPSARYPMKPDQMEIVAVAAMRIFPQVLEVNTAYVFPLSNQIFPFKFTRNEDEARIWQSLLPRVKAMEQAVKDDAWPATPNPLCGWCPYKACPHNTNVDN